MSTSPHLHDDLLHAALDGELSAEDRAEVERLLATDADARERFRELQKLTVIVEELGNVAPPARLARTVLTVASTRSAALAPSRVTHQGETFMARKTMIGLAA